MANENAQTRAQANAKQSLSRRPCALERAAFCLACAAGVYTAISTAINDPNPDAGATLVSQADTSAAMTKALQPK